MECTAVDALVESTKGNIDAFAFYHISRSNRHARLLLLIPNKVPWLIDHVIRLSHIKLERTWLRYRPFTVQM